MYVELVLFGTFVGLLSFCRLCLLWVYYQSHVLNILKRELSLKSVHPCQMPRQLVAAGDSQVPQQQDQDVEDMEEEPVEQEGEGYGK